MTDQTQLARLGLFDAKAPRYTSYPTAPHFTPQVEAGQYSAWLADVPADAAISVYVHIPFCRRLCWFCACRTQGVKTNSPVEGYLETLKQEIDMVAAQLPAGVSLARLHWGGGTPTILPPEWIVALAAAIKTRLPFAAGAEFSVEIDPNEVDEARLDALAAAGMNRASIGIQDFDPKIQTAIGRIQSYETTRDVAEKLRARGIHSLNSDILYGLPYQDKASISRTTEQVLSLSPDRVALYGYAHVPWMARRQTMIPDGELPDSEKRLALYQTARDLFLAAGYQAVGIDHFAKPGDGLARAATAGHLRRNFQGYTDDRCAALIGLGASAISRLPQGYMQNASATAAYQAMVRDGKLAAARGHEFSDEDRYRARVIEQLMCAFEADLSTIPEGAPGLAARLRRCFLQVQAKYAPFVTVAGDRLTILPKGQPLTRMIAREFDAYVSPENGHSLAI